MQSNVSESDVRNLSRVQSVLERNLARAGVKPSSLDYCTNCLDPFHDLTTRVEGYPDAIGGKSVVQAIVRQKSIVVPTALGGAWDCHIATNPALLTGSPDGQYDRDDHFYPVAFSQSDTTVNGYTPGELMLPIQDGAGAAPVYTNYNTISNVMPRGVITICAGPPGLDTFNPIVPAYYDSINIEEILGAVDQESRIIGIGFEIRNVTNALAVAGTLTCYRMYDTADDAGITSSQNVARQQVRNATTRASAYSAHNSPGAQKTGQAGILHRRRRLPPPRIADATQLDSVTWEAKEGCLVPVNLDYAEGLKPKRGAQCASVQMFSDAYANAAALGVGYLPVAAGSPVDIAGADVTAAVTTGFVSSVTSFITDDGTATPIRGFACSPSPVLESQIIRSGAYFTGLPNTTSLTIIVRIFAEQFPHPTSLYMPLASPSPPFDALLPAVLSEITSQLKPAYPASFNDFGDFLRSLAGIAGKVVGTFVGRVPVIGGLLESGAGELTAYVQNKIKHDQPQQQAGQNLVVRPGKRKREPEPQTPRKKRKLAPKPILKRAKRSARQEGYV